MRKSSNDLYRNSEKSVPKYIYHVKSLYGGRFRIYNTVSCAPIVKSTVFLQSAPRVKRENTRQGKEEVSFRKVHRKATRGRREHTTRRRCLFAKSTARRQEGEESGRSAYVPEVGGLARRPPQGKREKRANVKETVSYVHAHTHTHRHRHKEILESQCPSIFTM